MCVVSVLSTLCLWTLIQIISSQLWNAALFKPAYQSSNRVRFQDCLFSPSYVNDGNTYGYIQGNSCTHTLYDDAPWWMVDMQRQYTIDQIVVSNRIGIYLAPRLANFTIDVFTSDPRQDPEFPYVLGEICFQTEEAMEGKIYTWNCSEPVIGRYVRLILFHQQYLHICELMVMTKFPHHSSYVMEQNTRVTNLHTIESVTARTVLSCANKCTAVQHSYRCGAFHWIPSNQTCQLLQGPIAGPLVKVTSSDTHFYIFF